MIQASESGIVVPRAPFVRVNKRTALCNLNQTITEAARASVGSPFWSPVYAAGLGRVAMVRGRGWRDPRVDIVPLPEKMWTGFATYDDLISEITAGKKWTALFSKAHTSAPVANTWADLWPVAGAPTAGTYGGTARTSKPFDDTATGALLHGGNVSTDTKHLLSEIITSSAGTPTLWLVDRVLSYETCAFSAAVNQAMVNTVSAGRYIGASASGMQVMVVADSLLGATASNMTRIEYVTQAGATGRLMPTAVTKVITTGAAAPTTALGARCVMPLGLSPWMELQAGDTGVSSIANYTTSAANTGTMTFLQLRPLALMPTFAAGIPAVMDLVAQVASLERVIDGACLSFIAFFPAATATTVFGRVEMGWG